MCSFSKISRDVQAQEDQLVALVGMLALFSAWTGSELAILIASTIIVGAVLTWTVVWVLKKVRDRKAPNAKLSRRFVALAAVGALLVGAGLGVLMAENSVNSRAEQLENITNLFKESFPDAEVSDVAVSGKDGSRSTANLTQGDCSWTVTLGGSSGRPTFKATNLVAGDNEAVAQQRGSALEETMTFIVESCAAN